MLFNYDSFKIEVEKKQRLVGLVNFKIKSAANFCSEICGALLFFYVLIEGGPSRT